MDRYTQLIKLIKLVFFMITCVNHGQMWDGNQLYGSLEPFLVTVSIPGFWYKTDCRLEIECSVGDFGLMRDVFCAAQAKNRETISSSLATIAMICGKLWLEDFKSRRSETGREHWIRWFLLLLHSTNGFLLVWRGNLPCTGSGANETRACMQICFAQLIKSSDWWTGNW